MSIYNVALILSQLASRLYKIALLLNAELHSLSKECRVAAFSCDHFMCRL